MEYWDNAILLLYCISNEYQRMHSLQGLHSIRANTKTTIELCTENE